MKMKKKNNTDQEEENWPTFVSQKVSNGHLC